MRTSRALVAVFLALSAASCGVFARDPNRSDVLISGPASCETCNVFDGARWCQRSLLCYIPLLPKRESAGHDHHRRHHDRHQRPQELQARATSNHSTPADVNRSKLFALAAEMCRHECGEECGSIRECFATTNRSCGDCVFAGGWWSPVVGACFLGSAENSDDVRRNCVLGDNENVCIRREAECPACSRVNQPIHCSPQLAGVVVSGVCAALFAALFAWTCYRAQVRLHHGSDTSSSVDEERPSRKSSFRRTPAGTPPTGTNFSRGTAGGGTAHSRSAPHLHGRESVDRTTSTPPPLGDHAVNSSFVDTAPPRAAVAPVATESFGSAALPRAAADTDDNAMDERETPVIPVIEEKGAPTRSVTFGKAPPKETPSQQMRRRRDSATQRSAVLPPLPPRTEGAAARSAADGPASSSSNDDGAARTASTETGTEPHRAPASAGDAAQA